MTNIRKADEQDIPQVANVLIPAFQDKILAIIGDHEKAQELLPHIIRSIEGEIFVATVLESNRKKIVGAIIISTTKFKISFPVIMSCLRTLGFLGSIRALRQVNNYLGSVPKIQDREGTLEAVGVLEEYNGKGIGEQLILQGEKYLRKNGKFYFGLGVKERSRAVELYQKLGFEIIESYRNDLGNWLYMAKGL